MLPEIGDLHKLALNAGRTLVFGDHWLIPFAFILEGLWPRKELCPWCKDALRAIASQSWVSPDSLFSLTPLLPPLSWNCILLPTQQPVSVPSPINMQLGFHFHFHSQSQY